MIKMELELTGSDECGRWSPTTSPRGADNGPPRDRSRTNGSKDGLEFWDTWSKIGMDGSISSCKHFDADKYRKGGKHTCLPMKHELKEEDIPRVSKRVRRSDHRSKEHSKDSLREQYRSHERIPQRHGTDSHHEEKHELLQSRRFSPCHDLSKGKCQSSSTSNYANHAPFHGGKHMKEKLRERIHHRRDTHASLGHRKHHRVTSVPRKYFGEGHSQKVEVYSSSPPWKPHDRTDNRSRDHKHAYNVERNNSLSRNSSLSGVRSTSEAHRSSKWRSNVDRQVSHLERQTSSSWNEPKLGEETANKDAPNSLKWNSENVIWAHDTKTDNAFSRNVPTWGDEATSEDAPHLSKWRSGTVNHACDKDTDINSPCTGPKWGDETNSKDAPRSCRSSTTKCDPWETRNSSSWNGPKWDDREATKDTPASSQWRLDADKWDCNVKTDNCSTWNGPKCSDETNTKVATNFSQWKSVTDNQGSNVGTNKSLSHTGPKRSDKTDSKDAPRLWRSSGTKWDSKQTKCNSPWNGTKGDGATIKDIPGSSQWRSDGGDCGSKVKTSNSSSWNIPKLGDETTAKDGPKGGDTTNAKDAPCSRRSSNTDWDPWETKNSTSWNGPNWNDRATTQDAPGSLQWRSDVNKWGSNAKADNCSSWTDSKWGDKTNAKDASCLRRSSNTDWDPWETKNSSQRDLNQDDRATTKDASGFLQWRSDVDKWGSKVKTDNCSSWTGPKLGDKTNAMDAPHLRRSSNTDWDPWETKNSSTRNGPNWDDRATAKDAPGSSQWRSDVDKWGSNVKTGNRSSWTGSKWGDKTNAKDASRSRRSSNTDWDPWETKDSSSRNGPNWDDRATTKDAPGSLQSRSDVDRWGSNVKNDNCSSWTDPKWGDKTNVMDAPHLIRLSNTDWDPWEAKNSSSRNGPNRDDRAITKDAPASLQWRSDVDKWGANVKTDNCSTWNGLKRGDETTSEDVPNSSWRTSTDQHGSKLETYNSLTWKGPKWGDQMAAKSVPDSSGCRPDNEKQSNNVESLKTSWNGPEWDDHITTKDAPKSSRQRSDGDERVCGLKSSNSFSWESPKGDRTSTKDLPNFSQYYLHGERKQNDMKANSRSSENGAKWGDQTSTKRADRFSYCRSDVVRWGCSTETNYISLWNGLKWDDQATMKSGQNSFTSKAEDAKNHCNEETKNGSSWNDPKWGDEIITKDASSLNSRLDVDVRVPDLGANNGVSWNDPKRIDQRVSKETPYGCSSDDDRHDHDLETEKASRNCVKWRNHKSIEDATKPGNEKRDYNLKPGNNFSYDAPELKNQLPAEVSPNDFQQHADDCKDDGLETNNSLSHNGSHQGDQTITMEAPKLIGDAVIEAIGPQTGQTQKEETLRHHTTECNSMKIQEFNKEDEKGILMFKFALVEFVKDILRPFWKEGHLSKEAHKTIVKKVVDKVIGASQGTDIPRTHRNIDLYMAYSKTKLTNLVQAYLERYATSSACVNISDSAFCMNMGSEGKMSAQSSAV